MIQIVTNEYRRKYYDVQVSSGNFRIVLSKLGQGELKLLNKGEAIELALYLCPLSWPQNA